MSDEKRDQGRAPIELKVEYKRLNTFFSDYTRNISKGGTFIRTERPLPVGTEFVFALVVPGVSEPLRLNGRVQWITSVADAEAQKKPPGMGIEFLYTEERERSAVASIVEKLMATELGDVLTSKLLGKN